MPQPGATSAKGLAKGGAKPPLKKADWSATHKLVANANSPFAAELFLQMNRCRTDPAGYSAELVSTQAQDALLVMEPLEPLEYISSGMTKACLDHVMDLKKVDLATATDVHTGRDGSTPLERLERCARPRQQRASPLVSCRACAPIHTLWPVYAGGHRRFVCFGQVRRLRGRHHRGDGLGEARQEGAAAR